METNETQQASVDQVYNFAANLLIHQNKNSYEVKTELMAKGLDEASAAVVVDNLENQIAAAKLEKAKKDMLYGALWCVGGIVATIANVGFIFWGAILFGGIQFFRGVANYTKA